MAARIGQQGTLTRIWANRGQQTSCSARPTLHLGEAGQGSACAANGTPAEGYLFGAVCPARAIGGGLVPSYAHAAVMNLHLAEISAAVALGAHAVFTIEGAGWHQTGDKLRVPDTITLLHLLPCTLHQLSTDAAHRWNLG